MDMKVLITAQNEQPGQVMELRFGRAPFFCVYDTESGKWESVNNTINMNAAQGAGIQAAQAVERLGAKVVITGHVGPKAFRVLEANQAEVYLAQEGLTVEAAMEAWKAGKLQRQLQADVEGHW